MTDGSATALIEDNADSTQPGRLVLRRNLPRPPLGPAPRRDKSVANGGCSYACWVAGGRRDTTAPTAGPVGRHRHDHAAQAHAIAPRPNDSPSVSTGRAAHPGRNPTGAGVRGPRSQPAGGTEIDDSDGNIPSDRHRIARKMSMPQKPAKPPKPPSPPSPSPPRPPRSPRRPPRASARQGGANPATTRSPSAPTSFTLRRADLMSSETGCVRSAS